MGYIALKEGSTLQSGKYIIAEILGQGGFGITYEANQVSLGRKVAIKEFFMKEYCERNGRTSRVSVPSSGSHELVERFRQKFIREARMIASLNHPNIVKIYDVFEENGTAYYVMEHLPGGSLSDMVRDNGVLPEEQCLDYIYQVSSALDYLHRRKTLHFDVKPSNILFDEDGRAVLIDFGISKHYDIGGHQTSSTPVGLSKGYAPLEQYRQDDVSTFTPATDIYSLGATLYNIATGITPPDASWVNEEGLERPSGISDCLWTAIEHSMQPRRKDRPQSIGEFLSLLDGKSGTAGNTGDNTDDETTRMDAAAFHSRLESKRTTTGDSDADPKPRQESKPKQKPKSSLKSNPSNRSRIYSVTDRNNVPRKGLPKWLYRLAALVSGLIVLVAISKSKHSVDTPVSEAPLQEHVVTPPSTPESEPEYGSKVNSITLNKTYLTLEESATFNLTVKYTPSDVTVKSITWRSTNNKVATVSNSGKVTAIKAGNASIIAKCGGKESSCNVTVIAKSQTAQQINNTTIDDDEIKDKTPAQILSLGYDYQKGTGGKSIDYSKALKYYYIAAVRGNDDAMVYIGYMYEKGYGVSKDYTEALKWYRKAAEQGNASAQSKLGYMYRNGYGVEKDYSEAVKWYRKSAEQGNANGQNNLGFVYEKGYGVSKDYTEALKWYRKSAEQGNANGQNNLGIMYLNGFGVEKDYSEAAKWFRKSAEQGNADGQCHLGYMYYNGYGVSKDYTEALKWYRKSAEQGDANGQCDLGCMYRDGYGVAKDYSEAVKWYRKSAEQGNANGQCNLGYMYEKGYGVSKDFSEAVNWYRKSAEQGNATAQHNLGLCYKNGWGVDKDLKEAKKWFEKAAAQGDEGAKKQLSELQ